MVHKGDRRHHTAWAPQGVGQTDLTAAELPEVKSYEVYKGDPECPKVFWQPGKGKNVQFVLSPQPLGPEKALGLKITPTRPHEQEPGNLDSLVDIQPMTKAEMAEVIGQLRKEYPASKGVQDVLAGIDLK